MKPQTIDDKLAIMRADNGLLAIDKAEIEVIRRPGGLLRSFSSQYDLWLIDALPYLASG